MTAAVPTQRRGDADQPTDRRTGDDPAPGVRPEPDEPSRSTRFQLDAYRAVAAVSVMTFHSYQYGRDPVTWRWPLQGTWWHQLMLATDLFVAMFFVLSGFLLGLPFARAALGTGRPRTARVFLLRRAARIMPAYYLVVLLVWALTNPTLPGDWRDLLLHLTFTHVYSQDKIFYTDGPTWSLAVEMHFYLLLALLGWLAQRCCRRLSSQAAKLAVLLTGIVLLILISVGYKLAELWLWHAPETAWQIWYGPLSKLDTFAIGLLLAVLAATGVRWRRRRTRLALIGTGVAVLGLGLATRPGQDHPAPFLHSITAVGCALIIAATALSAGPAPRWLGWRPLALLGLVSYSFFLWHEPLLRLLSALHVIPARGAPWAFPSMAVVLLAVTVPVAWLSYHVIERTGLKLAAAFDAHGRSRDYYAGTGAQIHPPPGYSTGPPWRTNPDP